MGSNRRYGSRLRELRKKAGLTQEQLGERAGVSYKFLGGIERGAENPSLAVLDRLARGLDLEVRELVDVRHLGTERELRREAHAVVERASPEEIRLLLRILRAIAL
ncbi:MAG: helix-turn-helix transcriptional regulator [Deltaproteobacteria bacterium]|nr:helix-turn-helix transcriptional regulator [Deltaproteobacteria bacterium]